MIVTFYSFKGGVGRSMAMANVAEILAGLGYNVVASDWDLEAPGLERYLASDRTDVERTASQPGLIDLLTEYKTTLTMPLPVDDTGVDTSTTATHASVGRVRLRRPSSYATDVKPVGPRAGTLRLLTAGARGVRGEGYGRYAEAVRTFSWNEFYDKWAGGAYMDFLRADLSAGRGEHDPLGPPIKPAADIVLIDSRTGVTEHGGVATHHLADVVVLMSAANDLNVEGTAWMADALVNPKLIELRSGRKLAVLPVPSRIEQTSEKNLLGQFRKTFVENFGRRLPGSVVNAAEEFFVDIEIPYMPFYSFTERVAAREAPSEREVRLYRAYEALAHAIVRCGFDLKVLEKSPVETSTRFQMPVPPPSPRGVFALVAPPDMRPPAEALGRALNQAQISISTDDRAAALSGSADATTAGVLILVGPDTPEGWVHAAFDAALRRQALNQDFRIVPIVDPAVRLSALPYLNRVRIVQAAISSGTTDVAPIVAALATASPAAREDAAAAPFPGLRAYEEAEARLFFGRDARLADLGATIRSATPRVRWIHLDDPSGSGKTSFVLASVIPALRLGSILPGMTCGPVAVCRVSGDALGSLAVALAKAAGEPEAATGIQEALRRPRGLADEIRRLTPGDATFVLFVDHAHALDESGAVAQLLRDVVGDPEVPLLLITASDGEWSHAFPDQLDDRVVRFRVGPMSADEHDLAAAAPARLAGLIWESDALALMRRDVEAMTGPPLALPLFGAALRAVWEKRSGNTLTAAAYEQFGAFVPALVREAERRIDELAPERRNAAKRLLVGLTKPNRDGTSDRRTISRAEAVALAGGGAAADSLIAALSASPPIIVAGDRVTISHDVLLERWTQLQQWIAEIRAVDYRLSTKKRTWVGAAAAAVLIAAVVGAQAWRARTSQARADSETLAQEALRAQDKDPLRGLAIAVAAGSNAETDPARAALERALADRYPRVVLQHPAPVIDASFNADGTRIVTAAEDNTVRVWDTTTGRIATISGSRQAIELRTPARVPAVRVSPSRPLAAIAGFDGAVTLLDIATGQSVAQLRGHSGAVVSLDFSPDGQKLATASFDGTALVWDVASAMVVAELRAHSAAVTSVRFDHDGTTLLTTSVEGTGKRWNRDGTLLATLSASTLQSANLGAFGGGRVAIGGLGGAIVASEYGQEVHVDTERLVTGLAFLADGGRLITASPDALRIWDAADGRELGALITPANTEGEAPQITDLAVDQRSGRIAAATAQGHVFIWDAAGASAPPTAVLRAHTDAVNRVAFSADGKYLLSAGKDDTVCVWESSPAAAPSDRSFTSLLQAGQRIVSRVFTPDQLATIVSKE
jgi:WD40 repeat protein